MDCCHPSGFDRIPIDDWLPIVIGQCWRNCLSASSVIRRRRFEVCLLLADAERLLATFPNGGSDGSIRWCMHWRFIRDNVSSKVIAGRRICLIDGEHRFCA
jgi:hypothetical protein